MFWMKKCFAAAALAAAVGVTALGIGSGRGPDASAQAQAAPPAAGRAEAAADDDILARLKELEAEQVRLAAQLSRLQAQGQELVALAKKRSEERARTGKRDGLLKITLGPPNSWNPSLFVDEFDKDGAELGSFRSAQERGVLVYLRRAARDPDGPRRVVVSCTPDTPREGVKAVTDACAEAGFKSIEVSRSGGEGVHSYGDFTVPYSGLTQRTAETARPKGK